MNWKQTGYLLGILLTLFLAIGIPVEAGMTGNGTSVFEINVSDSFDEEQGLTYARVVCLKHSGDSNGTLIATCDQHVWVNDEQVWPIYRSIDGGESWTHVTDVTDDVFGTNRKAQPMLYELETSLGDFPEGTLLLAGNLVPDDESSSRIVIYASTDVGETWTYISTVDTGGAFEYDRSPEATTTTIWEPFLYMDDYGHLICAFSDERQKSDGVLQAVSLKYTSDGFTWSEESNIAAIGNYNDRPGMVTVSRMGDGRYIATYEVVNRPSYDQNSSVVYCKFSEDGLNWEEDDLGVVIATSDGQCLGSSPYVIWVDAGGPNGMVVVGAKWVVNSSGDIQEGGQNFFVNYNYGEGDWERYPQAITWDGEDIVYLDAFSQCLATNEDDTVLYQIANIGDSDQEICALKIGALPLTMDIYEAENAGITDATLISCEDAVNLQEVGYINYSDSELLFEHVIVPTTGTYTVYVRYNNGDTSSSSHAVTVNGETLDSLSYPVTPDWHQYYWASFDCTLLSGTNSISLKYESGYAEIDCIAIYRSGTDLANSFMLENQTSGKYLEIPDMDTASGTAAQQYEITYYPCQVWNIEDGEDGQYTLENKNSGLLLGIEDASSDDGAIAIQEEETRSDSQAWDFTLTSEGYRYITNCNSSKYLEVFNNLTTNGAAVGQWGITGYGCQEWKLIKEGIQ